MENRFGDFLMMTLIFVLVLVIIGVMMGDPFVLLIKVYNLIEALFDMAGLLTH